METIKITCIDNERVKEEEILSKTDKHMKVDIKNTTMTIELHRSDLNKPYVGYKAGLEFQYED